MQYEYPNQQENIDRQKNLQKKHHPQTGTWEPNNTDLFKTIKEGQ